MKNDGQPVRQPKVELIITFDPNTGSIGVRGPLQQPMLALGMIEMAREAMLRDRIAEFIHKGGRKGGDARKILIPDIHVRV